MKKFIYFLADSPNYPNEIYAKSKEEVRRLIMDVVPSEDQIVRIVEASEEKKEPQAVYSDPDDFKNGADFFNAVVKAGIEKEQMDAATSDEKKAEPIKQVETVLPTVQRTEQMSPKYFEESGIQFKLENGKLFKRGWTVVSDDEIPQYRIINRSTNKSVPMDKYKIEKLEWIELQG